MRIEVRQVACAAAVLAAGCALGARATPPAAANAGSAASAVRPGTTVAGLGAGVAPATLAQMSGGTQVTESITVTGNVSSTSTSDVSTGYNWIGGGAFGNAAGLPMVIQNSGNSVLIQNATVVNVQLQP